MRPEAGISPLRRLLADLAPGSAVPDLGPGVVVDQLTVLVWDACAAGRGDGIPARLHSPRRPLG